MHAYTALVIYRKMHFSAETPAEKEKSTGPLRLENIFYITSSKHMALIVKILYFITHTAIISATT